MRYTKLLLWWCGLGVGLLIWTACGPEGWVSNAPHRAGSQPAEEAATAAGAPANPFGSLTPPAPLDSDKARLRLAQIPDDPPAAGKSTTRPAALPDLARRRIDEARRLFDEQRYSETIIEAEKGLRYEPGAAEGYRLIALASLLSGNETRAKSAAEKTLAIQPDNLAAHFVLARVAEKTGKNQDAIRTCRIALKCETPDEDRPFQALAHYYLGALLGAQGYYLAAAGELEAFEESLTSLGEKVADNPELATIARVRRGEAALTAAKARGYLGQYAQAADTLKRVVARLPRDYDLRAEYVRMLMRAKRVDVATQEAARLLADSQGSPESVQLLVAVHTAAGHPERAISTIKSVVARQPDSIELWLVYVDTLWSSGKTGEAFSAVRDLLARHPESREARWKLIELHRQREEWPAWAAQLVAYIAADPSQAQRVAQQVELIPKAAIDPTLQQLARGDGSTTQPADAAASARDYLRGRLLERLDRVEEASKAYDTALSRSPDSLPMALAAGELYLNRCRWKDAVRVLEGAQKGRSEPSAQIELALGRAYEGLDKTPDAVSHYTKAAQLDRSSAQASLLVAKLHERIGNAQAALKIYQMLSEGDVSVLAAHEGAIRAMLGQISSRTAAREQQSTLTKILGELAEMQKAAPQDPATLRCAALIKFLYSRDQHSYIDALTKLLAQYPDQQQTREDLVRVLLDAHDNERAFQAAREMVVRDRCSATAFELLVGVQVRMLDFAAAGKQYQRMIEMYPNRETWLGQYASMCSLTQEYDRAADLYKRLLQLDTVKDKPDRELVYRDKLVQVYRRQKLYDKARAVPENALKDIKEDQYRQAYRMMLLATDLSAKDYDSYLSRVRGWLKDDPKSEALNRQYTLGLIKAAQGPWLGRPRGETLTIRRMSEPSTPPDVAPDERQAASHLARNLASLRHTRSLTQDALAKAAAVPRSTIANLESGAGNPSLVVLVKVAAALGVPIDELLASPRALVRRWPASEVATRQKGRGVSIRELVPEPVPDEMMEVMDFEPGAVMGGTPHLPGTREFFTCLDGRVNLMVAGTRYELGEGDVLAFPGNQPHSYQNADAHVAARGVSVVVLAKAGV